MASIIKAAAPSEPPKADETTDEAALIGAFLSRVRIAPVPDSKLVDVYFQAQDAAFTATAANALVDEYVVQNLEVKQQSTQNMLEWLEHEVAAQQTKVEQSERELAAFLPDADERQVRPDELAKPRQDDRRAAEERVA